MGRLACLESSDPRRPRAHQVLQQKVCHSRCCDRRAVTVCRWVDEAVARVSDGCRQQRVRGAAGWGPEAGPLSARAGGTEYSARLERAPATGCQGASPNVAHLERVRQETGRPVRPRPDDRALDRQMRPRGGDQVQAAGCHTRRRGDDQVQAVGCHTRRRGDDQVRAVDCHTRCRGDDQVRAAGCRTRCRGDDQVRAVDCHIRDDLAAGIRGTCVPVARSSSRDDPDGRASSHAHRQDARRSRRSGAPRRRSRDALASNSRQPRTNRCPSSPNSPRSKCSPDRVLAAGTPSPAAVAAWPRTPAPRVPRRPGGAAAGALPDSLAPPDRSPPRQPGHTRHKSDWRK
jgi:hypothetical protein